MSIDFHSTQMGHIFYEGTMPKIAEALTNIGKQMRAARETEGDMLRALVDELRDLRAELTTLGYTIEAHAKELKDNTAMMESLAVEVDRLKK